MDPVVLAMGSGDFNHESSDFSYGSCDFTRSWKIAKILKIVQRLREGGREGGRERERETKRDRDNNADKSKPWHQRSSGRIHRCHRCDLGSIPG
jgi:hypothetical protein